MKKEEKDVILNGSKGLLRCMMMAIVWVCKSTALHINMLLELLMNMECNVSS